MANGQTVLNERRRLGHLMEHFVESFQQLFGGVGFGDEFVDATADRAWRGRRSIQVRWSR